MHSEPVQSAKDRYVNEIKRVTKVLDTILEGKQYLVGDKVTYADLSFVTWAQVSHPFWSSLLSSRKWEGRGIIISPAAPPLKTGPLTPISLAQNIS